MHLQRFAVEFILSFRNTKHAFSVGAARGEVEFVTSRTCGSCDRVSPRIVGRPLLTVLCGRILLKSDDQKQRTKLKNENDGPPAEHSSPWRVSQPPETTVDVSPYEIYLCSRTTAGRIPELAREERKGSVDARRCWSFSILQSQWKLVTAERRCVLSCSYF